MLGVVVARRPGALSLCLPRTFRPRGAIPPARSRASHGAPAPSPSRARAGWRRVAGSISDDRNAPQKIARSPRRVAPPARRLWPSRMRANLFFRASHRVEPVKNPSWPRVLGKIVCPLRLLYGAPTRLRDRLPLRAGREGCSALKLNAATLTRRSGDPPREPFAPRRALRRQKSARRPSQEQKGANRNRLFSNRHFRPTDQRNETGSRKRVIPERLRSAESHVILTIR